jgi:hypothetical protein
MTAKQITALLARHAKLREAHAGAFADVETTDGAFNWSEEERRAIPTKLGERLERKRDAAFAKLAPVAAKLRDAGYTLANDDSIPVPPAEVEPERCPACQRVVGDERGSGCPSDVACPVRLAEEASGVERDGTVVVEASGEVTDATDVEVDTDLRPALLATYKAVVDGWAMSAREVADGTGLDPKATTRLLNRLRANGLVDATHVNGEKSLTWQSYFDSQNDKQAGRKSTAAFNKAFPKGEVVSPAAERNGATGARYTEEQLVEAERRREAGETFKSIGQALGIKATAYLSKVLQARAAEREQAAKAKASKPRKSAGKKAEPAPEPVA